MPQYFHFERLVKKYMTEFEAVIPSAGGYDSSGEWQKDEPSKMKLHGAIISHRESKVLRSEGAITQQDRALYLLSPLPEAFRGAEVCCQGRRYQIGSELENGAWTGVWAYGLQYISPFGGVEGGGQGD